MDGLPPLPKSLSGFLSFGKESLTRAEATLGLTTNSNVKKNPTQAPPFHNGAFSRDFFQQKNTKKIKKCLIFLYSSGSNKHLHTPIYSQKKITLTCIFSPNKT